MSHVHFHTGNSLAAADYQAHLERMRALAQARDEELISKRTQERAFRGYIGDEEESAGEEGSEPDEDSSPPAETEADPEGGDEPPAGGARYA